MRNPFVPGFGLEPHVLVGREQLLADINDGLKAGPSDQRFTSLLTGVRGSGKTVALEAVQDSMEQQGWLVLQVDATTKGLPVRIIEAVQQAKQKYQHHDPTEHGTSGRRVSGISVAGFGINWAEMPDSPLSASGSTKSHLSALAATAAAAGTSVLLSIDELQGVDQDEFRRLAADIQHITSRKQLPLALLAAGLPQIKTTLLSDKKITFLQRCHKLEVPSLTKADALQGLRLTAEDAEARFEPDALGAAADEVHGSPYRLQLLGYNAWKISGAPNRPIDRIAVDEAIEITDETVTQNVSLPAWYDLNDTSQVFLESLVASKKGSLTASEVAAAVGVTPRHARRVSRELELSGYINVAGDGRLSLTDLVPEDVVSTEAALTRSDGTGNNESDNSSAASHKPLCGELMPRARMRCVLRRGHNGPCRSTI